MIVSENHGVEPKLSLRTISRDMNVSGLDAIGRVEEQTIGAEP